MLESFKKHKTKQLNSWLALALFSLLSANILAIFLIVLKIPFFSLSFAQPLFKGVLAYHVNLAMVFWMPMVACWLFSFFIDIEKIFFRSAIGFTVLALLLFVFSLVDVNHNIILSNYYPILQSYYFVAALVFQIIAVSVVAFFVLRKKINNRPELFLVKLASSVWFILVISIIGNYFILDVSFSSADSFERMLWAPGHIQQTMNSLLIATMWCFFLKVEKVSPFLRFSSLLAVVSCGAALLFAFVSTDEGLIRRIFTWQMSLFSWLPMAVVAVALLKNSKPNIYIKFSLLVALFGFIAGTIIKSGTLSIPGHYHGMTGAFNLAFFALLLNQLAKINNHQSRLTKAYGIGLIALIIGLTWAGNLGIGRKLIAEQQGILNIWQSAAIALVVIGAFMAIISSVFIIKSFFPRPSEFLFRK